MTGLRFEPGPRGSGQSFYVWSGVQIVGMIVDRGPGEFRWTVNVIGYRAGSKAGTVSTLKASRAAVRRAWARFLADAALAPASDLALATEALRGARKALHEIRWIANTGMAIDPLAKVDAALKRLGKGETE